MKVKQTKLSKKDGFDLGLGGLLNGFGGMMYEDEVEAKNRRVDRYEKKELIIDTAYMPDTGYFETGINDKRYYYRWIIVDEYRTKKEAQNGHKKWKKILLSKNLPQTIIDVHIKSKYKLKKESKNEKDDVKS